MLLSETGKQTQEVCFPASDWEQVDNTAVQPRLPGQELQAVDSGQKLQPDLHTYAAFLKVHTCKGKWNEKISLFWGALLQPMQYEGICAKRQ